MLPPRAAVVAPNYDISKLKMTGAGLEKAKVGEPTAITVDCSDAGEAPLAATVVNADGSEVPNVEVVDNGDGTKT